MSKPLKKLWLPKVFNSGLFIFLDKQQSKHHPQNCAYHVAFQIAYCSDYCLSQEKHHKKSCIYLRVCDSDDNDHIAHDSVCDEHLTAVQDPITAILFCIGSDTLKITGGW